MPMHVMRSLVATALVAQASCFGVAPVARVNNLPARSAVAMQASPPVTKEAAAPPVAQGMDERVFGFNKFVIDTVYDVICLLYSKNDLSKHTIRECTSRFYVLETVARVPYFAYLSVMHLRETFGSRVPGDKDRMRTHYAEADNELHHLLIMEALGGNSSVVDRVLAQSMAFVYYWYVTAIYAFNEPAAYHLSELIEDHAYNTYNAFLLKNEDQLKTMEVPAIARKYYEEDNPFLFDLFCTVKEPEDSTGEFSAGRPELKSLYDVFVNVRNDEREHWKTLCNLVQYDSMQGVGGVVTPTEAVSPEMLIAEASPEAY